MKEKTEYQFISNIESIDAEKWQKLLIGSENASIFQSLETFQFWTKIENHTPFVYGLEKASGELLALCTGVIISNGGQVKSALTRRAIIFGGPIFNKNIKDIALSYYLKEMNRHLSSKAIYAESRNLSDYSKYRYIFEENGWNYISHLNFHVDCSDAAQMKKRVSKSKIRQINKSLKTGAEIIEAENIEQVRDFYNILENLYKSKIKTPLPQWSFFKVFYETTLGKYLLIRHEERIVGGIMCPILPNMCIYEWYVCGLDGEIKDIYPSILATWSALQYAAENNIPAFDFMGAGKPGQDYGVREFKSKFGGELVEFGRFHNVYKPLSYRIGVLGVKLLKKI